MHDLVVDRSRPGVLYGATMCGLFTGHDNALAWLPTTNGLPEVTCWRPPLGCVTCDGPWAITSSPRHSKHLWVLTWDGTYHSLDAGRSWSAYPSDGLPEYVGWWKQIVIDPSGERLYTNAWGEGLFMLELDQGPRQPGRRVASPP